MNNIVVTIALVHAIGMLISALWFYPVYFRRQAKQKLLNVVHFLGVTLFGWVSLLCLVIDLNNDNPIK